MKRIILAMLLLVGSFSFVAADAEAKRFGSRGSIGKQSPNVSRQAQPAAAPQANQAQKAGAPNAAAAAPKPAMPWKGIVGGLIGGALLAGLFSSLGLGGALSSMLGSILTFAVIGGLIFFLFRFFTRKKNGSSPAMMNSPFQPAYAGAASGNNVSRLPEIGSGINASNATNANATSKSFQGADLSTTSSGSSFSDTASNVNSGNWEIPADFDVSGFLRHAKMNFIRMQAAWDKADLVDIREFTSPEMFAEIKMQLQDRGAETNLTDVVTIDAELLGIETQANDYLASIKFTGMIKEDINASAEAFSEVWNLAKPVNGQGGWLVVGIQQQ